MAYVPMGPSVDSGNRGSRGNGRLKIVGLAFFKIQLISKRFVMNKKNKTLVRLRAGLTNVNGK